MSSGGNELGKVFVRDSEVRYFERTCNYSYLCPTPSHMVRKKESQPGIFFPDSRIDFDPRPRLVNWLIALKKDGLVEPVVLFTPIGDAVGQCTRLKIQAPS